MVHPHPQRCDPAAGCGPTESHGSCQSHRFAERLRRCRSTGVGAPGLQPSLPSSPPPLTPLLSTIRAAPLPSTRAPGPRRTPFSPVSLSLTASPSLPVFPLLLFPSPRTPPSAPVQRSIPSPSLARAPRPLRAPLRPRLTTRAAPAFTQANRVRIGPEPREVPAPQATGQWEAGAVPRPAPEAAKRRGVVASPGLEQLPRSRRTDCWTRPPRHGRERLGHGDGAAQEGPHGRAGQVQAGAGSAPAPRPRSGRVYLAG